MKDITVKAYAKINLAIDVLGKRPDGYHEILTVMEQVDLFDLVRVSLTENNQDIAINLKSNLPFLPSDSRNIAYKAAELMTDRYGGIGKSIINIDIKKNIPVAAGLAGGSADCAAVLHALNRLWDLNLNLDTLMGLGAELGADVPFCLAGQAALNEELLLSREPLAGTCALASGIGEKLELVPPLKTMILLSKPPVSVSTAQVYAGLNLSEIKERPNIQELTNGLRENNYNKIIKNMVNVLENYSLKQYPIIMQTKERVIREGKAAKVLMSGSGPTVFGLYTSNSRGKTAFSKIKQMNNETFLTRLL
ncbi:MAG: 4-(cytidine 5'-diphospho)-2-C-methyl-D-erythritol kinase [Eubacteriales bacterium]|nr:4-(cytidine 5'-diphospho)-2-C-methyl-D-erythritol kinase [Eubacteriales bacterium]